MDDKIRKMLEELGAAINEAVSSSTSVNGHIQKIRDEGFELYVMLDATIGINQADDENSASETTHRLALPAGEAQFRIDVEDLNFLRSVGIDPTRKVKSR